MVVHDLEAEREQQGEPEKEERAQRQGVGGDLHATS
jgi:hypothetical protein